MVYKKMIMEDHDSAHNTPRSSISGISSPRSVGSGASNPSSSQNYSFQQRKLRIPSERKKMDAAILKAPLVRHAVLPALVPIAKDRSSIVSDDASHGSIQSIDIPSNAPLSADNLANRNIVPHPPVSKPRNVTRKGPRRGSDTTSGSDKDEVNIPDSKSDLNGPGRPRNGVKQGFVRRNGGTATVSENDKSTSNHSQHLEKDPNTNFSASDPGEDFNRKSNEDCSLIHSYEDYLRQVSKHEEEGSFGETEEIHREKQTEKDDNIGSDSSSESDSSSSSISVSSLSGDESDHNDETLITEKAASTFEPLYSRPFKPNISKSTTNSKIDTNDNLDDNNILETLKNTQAMRTYETLMDGGLRTQSAPDLRSGKSFRTLDTLGYMCPLKLPPKIQGNSRQNVSSPDLQKSNFNIKYRPLPDIPIDNSAAQSASNDNIDSDDDGTIYESVPTRNMSQVLGSPSKPKISFKAVADRVVSLMPRLTTKEARSREGDRYMADIIKYLPDRTLRVYCGTWNMKGIKVMPESLDDYILPHESVFIQDIYAIGCQEGTPFRKEWEIRLQETLGPTHVLMYSGNFGVLHLSIFVRRELVWFCTGIEQDTVATRMAHKFKTKGAIAVCFNVFGTSLLFINSHFASNQEKLKERVNDYRTICKSLSIPFGEEEKSLQEPDVTRRFDRVFWFGDFNFRVNKSRAEVDKVFVNRSFEDRNERKKFIIDELIKHDQLCETMEKGKIFHGFREAPITFLPTYKFDVNTDSYDTSAKARVQSWTDRILYKSKQHDQIKVAAYDSCTTIRCSDHRPVYCILEAKIEPIKKNVLLPAAMFDREIYVEANIRRSAPRGNQQASNVCTIL